MLCASQIPVALADNCGSVAAFLSYDATYQIVDMPTRYSYNAAQPLFWFNRTTNELTRFAAGWAEIMDEQPPGTGQGAIAVTVSQGTGQSFSTDHFWTGSYEDGTHAFASPHDYTCQGWTISTSGGPLGTQGNATVLTDWIHSTENYISCAREMYVLCTCKLSP
jgi:hypothetical protein